MAHQNEKQSEVLIKLAGEFLSRNSNGESLITITRAENDDKGSQVSLFVSVLPDSAAEKAMKFLKRSRSDFRDYVKKYSALQRPPTIDFVYDIGEKNRQRVFELTSEIPEIQSGFVPANRSTKNDAPVQIAAPVTFPTPTKTHTQTKKRMAPKKAKPAAKKKIASQSQTPEITK